MTIIGKLLATGVILSAVTFFIAWCATPSNPFAVYSKKQELWALIGGLSALSCIGCIVALVLYGIWT